LQDLNQAPTIKRLKTLDPKKNFLFCTTKNPFQYLVDCVNNGYVLHGSSRYITGEFIPQLTTDASKEFGNRKAIYLTSDPIVAMFRAYVGGIEIRGREDSKSTEITDEGEFIYSNTYFAVGEPEKVREKGYVYIFLKDIVDESYNLEHVSYKKASPILALEVSREDFPYEIEKLS
jgi:hypothetical protein